MTFALRLSLLTAQLPHCSTFSRCSTFQSGLIQRSTRPTTWPRNERSSVSVGPTGVTGASASLATYSALNPPWAASIQSKDWSIANTELYSMAFTPAKQLRSIGARYVRWRTATTPMTAQISPTKTAPPPPPPPTFHPQATTGFPPGSTSSQRSSCPPAPSPSLTPSNLSHAPLRSPRWTTASHTIRPAAHANMAPHAYISTGAPQGGSDNITCGVSQYVFNGDLFWSFLPKSKCSSGISRRSINE